MFYVYQNTQTHFTAQLENCWKLCWRSDLSTAPVFVVPLALAVVLAGELRQHPGGVQGPGVALSPGAHDEPLAGRNMKKVGIFE